MSEPRPAWWHHAVVYEIYLRSFRDANGDGIGDLNGVGERVHYLADTLGVDAIWITPFYPSPMADFGYDVSDHHDVDPLFGDLAAFDRLLASAHQAGLRVLIDFVPNHTSDRHPWFIESRSCRESARRDWYVWRDPKPDGSPPNNWLSVFGGSAWTLDGRTGQCYLHSFLAEQPDLNWRNPAVRAAMLDTMRFWLDRGVDGFRIDAPLFMMKDPEERDNPPAVGGTLQVHKSRGAYDAQLHLYDQGHPDIQGVFRDMRALLDRYEPVRTSLAELHEFDPIRLGGFYGADKDGLHMPANFGLMKAPWTAAGVRGAVDGVEAGIPVGAWPNWVLGTHDDTRLATRLGARGARQAAVLLLTLRGSPTLYYGDELGMLEAEILPERRHDPWGMREPALGRDGCRTPMPWSAGPNAGFTPAPEPWLPVGEDAAGRNVEAQLGDHDSILALYRRLLRLRRASPALREGAYRSLDGVPAACFVYERYTGAERAVVAINFSDEPRAFEHPDLPGRIAASTERSSEGREVAGRLELGPQEAVVLD